MSKFGSLWFLLACSKTIHHRWTFTKPQQAAQVTWQELSDMTNILPTPIVRPSMLQSIVMMR
jgi:hypothetical protein